MDISAWLWAVMIIAQLWFVVVAYGISEVKWPFTTRRELSRGVVACGIPFMMFVGVKFIIGDPVTLESMAWLLLCVSIQIPLVGRLTRTPKETSRGHRVHSWMDRGTTEGTD